MPYSGFFEGENFHELTIREKFSLEIFTIGIYHHSVTGHVLNIEYYFWWRDYCFGLLIHDYALFHFMVSISDEYKYKRLVKTTFKSCGKLIFLELYHTRN